MRLHLIMVLMSGTSAVGHREGCYASFWWRLSGNILEKIYNMLSLLINFFLRQYTYLTKKKTQRPWPTHHEDGTARILALCNSHAAGSGERLHHGCEGFGCSTSLFSSNSTIPTYKIAWYCRTMSFLRCQVQKY
jgi:hypothetical protein